MFQGTLNSWFKIQLYTYVPFMLQDLYSMLTLCEKTRFQWALNDCPWGVSMKSKLELCCEAPSPTNDARPSLHNKCCEAPCRPDVQLDPPDGWWGDILDKLMKILLLPRLQQNNIYTFIKTITTYVHRNCTLLYDSLYTKLYYLI